MQLIRTLLFYAGAFVLTLVFGFAGLPFLATRRACRVFARVWVRIMLGWLALTCGLRYRISGEIPSCDQRFFVAAQHQSAFETLILFFLFPRAVFMLKRSLLFFPVCGLFFWRLGMIPVARGGRDSLRDLNTRVCRAARGGETVIIFPEGTRVAPGERRAYRSGIFHFAKTAGLSVLPISLNTGLFWARRGFIKYPGCAEIAFRPLISIKNRDREDFLNQLRESIAGTSL